MSSTASIADPDQLLVRPCPVCAAENSTLEFMTIRKCCRCGLRFVSPLGDFRGENETEEYFLNEYLPLHRANWDNSLAERRAHLALIQKHSTLPDHPRVLDVGCALGFMLAEARALGWDAVGLETSEFAARYASEHTGCPVHVGNLQNANFPSNSFDVVTLMDIIEHVPDPCALLREVFRVLRPGGTIFLVTPNFGSFFVWLYRESAYGIGPEEHVTYFNSRSMETALANAGFRTQLVGSKDFYANNLSRLTSRGREPATIKASFGYKPSLTMARRLANRLLLHARVGDKLIAIARK